MPERFMPEIPHPEHPEQQEVHAAAEALVAEKVRSLDIGLDLDRHPEVRSRLAELGTHFEDSLDIARIIRTLYADLRRELELSDEGPERIMRSAVLHDIGKSGPVGEKGAFHHSVRRLFVTPARRFNPYIDGRAKTVAEFMTEQGMDDAERVNAGLAEAGIDPATETMIGFWRRHAEWTYDILRADTGPDIDEKTVLIAASHHLLEGQNPAHLELQDIPPEAHVIEMLEQCEMVAAVDKYQAFRARGGSSHGEAIAKLRTMVDANKEYPQLLKDKFSTVLNILERSESALGAIFAKE